jgi:predicted secreted protein
MAEFIIGEDHNGSTVSARVGDSIILKLPEVPATAFRWELGTVDSQSLALSRDEFEATSQAIGGGGLRVLYFVAKKAGSVDLQLKLARPWESGTTKNVFRVRITITSS